MITASDCLGILIPPSVMLIVYGATAGVSVVQLYAGAFFPGIMPAALYIVYVIIVARLKPELALPLPDLERDIALRRFAPGPLRQHQQHGAAGHPRCAQGQAQRRGAAGGSIAPLRHRDVAAGGFRPGYGGIVFVADQTRGGHRSRRSAGNGRRRARVAARGHRCTAGRGVQEPPSGGGVQAPPGSQGVQAPPGAVQERSGTPKIPPAVAQPTGATAAAAVGEARSPPLGFWIAPGIGALLLDAIHTTLTLLYIFPGIGLWLPKVLCN